jgi:Holliday junction DNA helicase RuvA
LIARIEGKLVAKDLDSLEVMTSGGVAYELKIPLGVYETLPRVGDTVSLHTSLVVKEDSWQLFGFASVFEKRLFESFLRPTASVRRSRSGCYRRFRQRDSFARFGRRTFRRFRASRAWGEKKAERLILISATSSMDWARRPGHPRRRRAPRRTMPLRALVSLGYSSVDAERGVRAALTLAEAESPRQN